MSDLFVDSSGWACRLDSAQRAHAEAKTFIQLCRAQGRRLVTTSYVVAETIALLDRLRVPRARAMELLDGLLNAPRVETIYVDAALHRRAWALLMDRLDKT